MSQTLAGTRHVLRRLAGARRALDALALLAAGGGTTDPGDAAAELDARARRLAQPAVPERAGATLRVLTMTVAGTSLAVEVERVVEVFRLERLARVPGARPALAGITAWRGEVLSLVDVRGALGLSTGALHDLARVVVLGDPRAPVGVLVDAVDDVRDLPGEALRPPPADCTPAWRALVRAVTSDAVLVLDVERLAHPDL